MLPSHIYLTDRNQHLVRAWSEAFSQFDSVEAIHGDFFDRDADAMVSPANSFGIMDGGLDLAIRSTLGGQIQEVVQRAILEKHHGELHVGAAEIVATGHARWPFLAVAPTMRVPETVANTLNAYLAFRALLLAVAQHNTQPKARRIESIVVPGLATGIGAMEPRRCAAQMRMAFDQVRTPARIPSYRSIHALHAKLRSAL